MVASCIYPHDDMLIKTCSCVQTNVMIQLNSQTCQAQFSRSSQNRVSVSFDLGPLAGVQPVPSTFCWTNSINMLFAILMSTILIVWHSRALIPLCISGVSIHRFQLLRLCILIPPIRKSKQFDRSNKSNNLTDPTVLRFSKVLTSVLPSFPVNPHCWPRSCRYLSCKLDGNVIASPSLRG